MGGGSEKKKAAQIKAGMFHSSTLILMGLCIGVPIVLVRGCTTSFSLPRKSSLVSLWDEKAQTLRRDLEEYVQGLWLRKCLPASIWKPLKAQAVAARTYAYRRILRGDTLPDHPEANLSSDYTSGQAWVSWNDFLARFGLKEGAACSGAFKRRAADRRCNRSLPQ